MRVRREVWEADGEGDGEAGGHARRADHSGSGNEGGVTAARRGSKSASGSGSVSASASGYRQRTESAEGQNGRNGRNGRNGHDGAGLDAKSSARQGNSGKREADSGDGDGDEGENENDSGKEKEGKRKKVGAGKDGASGGGVSVLTSEYYKVVMTYTMRFMSGDFIITVLILQAVKHAEKVSGQTVPAL